jgi:hypothetical protein
MNDYWKGVSTAVIGAGVIGLASYLLIIKENQIEIRALRDSIQKLELSDTKTQASLNTTRLFVAQAHPNRTLSLAPSLKKLGELDRMEIELLAGALTYVEIVDGVDGGERVKDIPPSLKVLFEKYNLTTKDLVAFHAVGTSPTQIE